jgi:hypothetical protein
VLVRGARRSAGPELRTGSSIAVEPRSSCSSRLVLVRGGDGLGPRSFSESFLDRILDHGVMFLVAPKPGLTFELRSVPRSLTYLVQASGQVCQDRHLAGAKNCDDLNVVNDGVYDMNVLHSSRPDGHNVAVEHSVSRQGVQSRSDVQYRIIRSS